MPRIWLVTGSSRGLGLALAYQILDAGDSLIATARNAADVDQLVRQYGNKRVLALELDVADADQADRVVQTSMKTFGRIDVVVNNAGYADQASIEDMPMESFRAQMETNFFGVVHVTKAVIPIMRQQGSGRIIQIASVGGRMGSPGLGAYQSAKWAVNGFTTVLAKEVTPLGIKVTSCEPGGIKTDWAGPSMSKLPVSKHYEDTVAAFGAIRERSIAEAGSNPEDIARAIVHISRADNPPVRLLLGRDTVEYAKKVSEDLSATDNEWRHVTNLSF